MIMSVSKGIHTRSVHYTNLFASLRVGLVLLIHLWLDSRNRCWSLQKMLLFVLGTGGKKNRQKERRLMKGFNIGPQPSTSSGSLPPVAEFIASLQHHHEGHHHDFFGSTLSGIFNSTTHRKLHQHSSTVSSSQGSINEGHHHHHHHHHKR